MIASKQIQPDESVLSGSEIAVILPAWNEGGHIGAVLASIPDFVRHVIVVDDASSDNTALRVQECAEIDTQAVRPSHRLRVLLNFWRARCAHVSGKRTS